MFNGKLITSSSYRRINYSLGWGTIEINDVEKSDEGEYSFLVTGPMGSSFASAELNVIDPLEP